MARTLSLRAEGRLWPAAPKRLLALAGDDALVAHIRCGNEAAFEVAFERHGPGVLSFCRHMLGSLEAAEDAVQQTFASAHSDLLRSDREIRLKPWLYAIARNRCISVLRASREQPTAELVVETVGLHEEVQRRADLRELLSDLADLPAQQRAALVLSELGDLSHPEIAEVLGMEARNVKSLVFRARSGLIERRDAREAPCEEVRERLANLRGGALRSVALRQHLKACAGCSAYLDDVRRQRRMLALMLPVVPTVGLKRGVLAAAGLSAGPAGGSTVAGGIAGYATFAKAATVLVLAGGTGVVGGTALENPAKRAARPAPEASRPQAAPSRHVPASNPAGQARHRPAAQPGERTRARRHGAKRPTAGAPARSHAQSAPASKHSGKAKTRVPKKAPSKGASSAPGRRAHPPKRPAAPRRGGLRALGSPAPKPPAKPKALKKD